MKDTRETCLICFTDYLVKNTKEHQCIEFWSCGACGEICEIESGIVTLNQGLKEFTHKPELCPAQDEIETMENIWQKFQQELTDPALNCECGYQH